MGFIAILLSQLPSIKTCVSVPKRCKTIKNWMLALWFLKMFILQCSCSIRWWLGNTVNGEQMSSCILIMGVWTDCRGCIITIIPYPWFCMERIAWIHFYKLFWSSSSGTCASSWRSSNVFTLSCLGMIIFICTHPLIAMFFLLLPLVILETFFCGRKQFSAAVYLRGQILIPHYNAKTLSLRHTLGDKIDNAR
jgi:hypothetical protein